MKVIIKEDLLQLEEDYPDLVNVPNERKITVISTSLIEAGVDLDFYSVYRELSGLDNILQSGGRCNREGKRKDARVEIFELSDEKYKIKHDDGRSNICLYLIKKYKNILDENAIEEYYNQLFFLQHDNIIKNSIRVYFSDIEKDGYNIKIYLYTNIIDYDEYIEFINNVNSQILALLEHENVKLIYPTIQIER